MTRDTKILQSILDAISSLREEMNSKFDSLEKEVKKNGKRIDKLGADLAYLEDDAPTTDEFENLKKRVTKLEKQRTLN